MAFQGRSMYPGGDQGYSRPGADFVAGGSGSGMGQMAMGTAKLSQGLGSIGGGQGWEPTVTYMVALLIFEMILFHVLSRMLK